MTMQSDLGLSSQVNLHCFLSWMRLHIVQIFEVRKHQCLSPDSGISSEVFVLTPGHLGTPSPYPINSIGFTTGIPRAPDKLLSN